MDVLIAKAVERLGKKKLWVLVHVVDKLPESERTVGGVRNAFRSINVFINDIDFAMLASQFGRRCGGVGILRGVTTVTDESAPFDVETFKRSFLPSLSPRRQYVVSLSLKRVPTDGSGFITFDELMKVYDTARHPKLLLGWEAQALERMFLNDFWEAHSDGGITVEELTAYLVGISHKTVRDEDFELHCIRSFSLDRPKVSLEERMASAASTDIRLKSIHGTKQHPLYQASSSDYGKGWETVKYDGKFACKYTFTKNLQSQCTMGPNTMNM
ncbi:uncharacterized protein TEOVI_000394300 [Trypanosoma equiperdum]|uniref:EF-hand domain-containing protein n=2 Tax=Trypanozoon TaxID=39700 RepID=Q57XA3_TRYB2|nr:hypothetical protein, conserved [Trypanosoma brucei brucei TREU927]AAX69766.1 hypothetical protein, conserved [Trypanosoma brucei]AAZ12551.1 hypothetical protein, conserved [Trypanosoma brucei brucei TREU927]SCU72367.1 hypothetical protein, conserved [Trypanosoma equiperdum]